MRSPTALWVGFNLVVLAMVTFDIRLARSKPEPMRAREALFWTLGWVSVSLLFALGIYLGGNRTGSLQFVTGYLIEYALSIDNLFVFVLIFQAFHIPPNLQRRLLAWGVVGALVLRASLILGGVALVTHFEKVFYLFGAFLVVTGVRMAWNSGEHYVSPGSNVLLRVARRLLPMAPGEEHTTLTVRVDGRRRLTHLFLVLLAVESTDLLFALDSIPAVLGISKDPFILYSSNVCAVLGLRSLFFLVSSLMQRLRYLKHALAAILLLIGAKMIAETFLSRQFPMSWSLGAVGGLLAVSVLASAVVPPRRQRPAP